MTFQIIKVVFIDFKKIMRKYIENALTDSEERSPSGIGQAGSLGFVLLSVHFFQIFREWLTVFHIYACQPLEEEYGMLTVSGGTVEDGAVGVLAELQKTMDVASMYS